MAIRVVREGYAMKRILLITGGFPPDFSPRMGYLCKWLAKNSDWRMVAVRYALEGKPDDYPVAFKNLAGYAEREFSFVYDDGIHKFGIRSLLKSLVARKIGFGSFGKIFLGKLRYAIDMHSFELDVKRAIKSALTTDIRSPKPVKHITHLSWWNI